MAARSARVSALSDKIQGLKFMQRGAGVTPSSSTSSLAATSGGRVSTPVPKHNGASTASPSTNERSNVTRRINDDDDGGAEAGSDVDGAHNDEHWVAPNAVRLLRRAAKKQQKRETIGVTVTTEPGWHAWLGRQTGVQTLEEAAEGLHAVPDDDAAAALVSSIAVTRRSFGAWASDGKKGKRNAAKHSEDEDDFDSDSQFSSGDEDNGEKERSRAIAKTGFIKPGYLSGDKDSMGSTRKDKAAAKHNVNKVNVSAVAARNSNVGQPSKANKRKSDSNESTPKRKRKANEAHFESAAGLKGFEG